MSKYKFSFGSKRILGKYKKADKLWEGVLSKGQTFFKGDKYYDKKYSDDVAMNELELYLENDGELYRQQFMSIIENLKKKLKSGAYNHELAPKLWLYYIENGAKKYAKEFASSPSEWKNMFKKTDRIILSQKLADYYHDTIVEGEYGDI